MFVSDEGEETEAVTIDIQVKYITLSVISAYGPQKSEPSEKITTFWPYLTKGRQRAKALGKGFVLQGDMNAWRGPSFIKGNSHEQNQNGKLFSNFLHENYLICVISLPLTEGVVTRS